MFNQAFAINTSQVQSLAHKGVQHINKLISSFCHSLQLHHIVSAQALNTNKNLLAFKSSSDKHGRVPDFSDTMNSTPSDVMITLMTSPNNGLYEMTIDSKSGKLKQISRLNAYKGQADCVKKEHPHLRAYCYCRKA